MVDSFLERQLQVYVREEARRLWCETYSQFGDIKYYGEHYSYKKAAELLSEIVTGKLPF